MRRKDREVTDQNEILDILQRCNTIRVGIADANHPYVVPVSFGLEIVDGNFFVYFHCAQQGFKLDLLKKNSSVCIEGDIFYKVEPTEQGITTRYESIIGFRKCTFLSDDKEIIRCLRLITEHYGYPDYPLERCKGLANLFIGKIAIDTITGKRNL